MKLARRRCGENSAMTTGRLATRPPIPRPVSTRAIPSCVAFWVTADIAIVTITIDKASTVMRRRPMRSASGAMSADPKTRPTPTLLRRRPIWVASSFHSPATDEAENAMRRRS